MSPPLSRRKMLALTSTTSISFLAGCQGLTAPFSRDTADPQEKEGKNNETLGLAYSESKGSSFPSEDESHSGWVHIVSDGGSADLTFDVRLCSSLGDVEPELSNSIGNEYILRFNISAELSGKSLSDDSTDESTCDSVTHLIGGANVPNDWEILLVYVNNTEIQSIEKSGTMPELRPLPDPVQFE